MEKITFLNRYRLSLGGNGAPVELHRTPAGVTYRAHQINSGREVALELVPWSPPDESASEQMKSAAAAAKQISHPNIPVLHDFGIEDGQLIYVTDYFEGYTAEAWVGARGPLPVGAVLRIALQVVGALGAASFHRIQHSAINPANLIFLPGQTAQHDWPAIKVMHWLGPHVPPAEGAGARADAAARFLSPEQLRGGEVNFASAIFSLGCTMWFLLTGALPAVPGGPEVRVGVEKLRGVPKIVRHLLGRMLHVDPAERPQDPVVLQAYLQTCLGRVERGRVMSRRLGLPSLARPRAVEEARTARNWRRRPVIVAAFLLFCGTVAVLALPGLFRARKLAPENLAVQAAAVPPRAPLAAVSSGRRQSLPNDAETEAPRPRGSTEMAVKSASLLSKPGEAKVAAASEKSSDSVPEIVEPSPPPTSNQTAVASRVPAPTPDETSVEVANASGAQTLPNDAETETPRPRGSTEMAVKSASLLSKPGEAKVAAAPEESSDSVPEIVESSPPPSSNQTAVAAPTPDETPVEVASASGAQTLPNDETTEPAAPAEGPGEVAQAAPQPSSEETDIAVAAGERRAPMPEVVAAKPQFSPDQTAEAPAVASSDSVPAPPGDSADETPAPVEPPLNQPHPATDLSSAPPLLATTPGGNAETAAKSSLRKKAKSRSIASSKTSAPRSRKKGRVAHAEVRKGRKFPALRVGENRAELVGTTADGRWILSVAESGQRIIVPPPPGFTH